MVPAAARASAESGWEAGLRLGFERRGARTILAERRRHGPLAVQRTFHPEGEVAHVYLLHPPGGIAGGDRLDIQVGLGPGARALLTAPGAAKCYRSAGPRAVVRTRLRVGTGAALEWLPHENILFPGARIDMDTRIDLDAGARFIGWELHCLGRPSIDECFTHGTVDLRLALHREERPLLLERLRVDADSLGAAAGLRGRPVVATLLATPVDEASVETLRESCPGGAGDDWGVTRLGDVLVARWLGHSTERARRWFETLWRALRPLVMERPPCTPRIWHT